MELVVFSHLRWDFVFQRPQHLLSRLAAKHPVLFIEEPVFGDAPARLEELTPAPNLRVLRPHTPVDAPGFHDDQLAFLKPLIEKYLEENVAAGYAVWFYTPMALPLLADLKPAAVIYDCMDELNAFKNAPRQMLQREAALMRRAELVLTGGPSLYEAKRGFNPRTLCLPSAVDAAHFMRSNALAKPQLVARAEELQAAVGNPRLGYYGVIDERLDLDLVQAIADADPAWQIVMVGPVVKIDEANLPNRPNIHWLGQQSYDLLPQLVATWDVCLMPFALNESTRFISPTKTLEYMAAGRAVVSTGVHDVISLYGDVVRIGLDPASFIRGCREALAETPAMQAEREQLMAAKVSRYSWDNTAQTISENLTMLAQGSSAAGAAPGGKNGAAVGEAGTGHRVA